MSFAFGAPRPTRRPSLTPMIDVVFLLLVFFMLAARFGVDGVAPLAAPGGSGDWDGPPRLLSVSQDGLRLNGVAVESVEALRPLLPGPEAPVLLRADGADVQRLVTVMEAMRAGALGQPVVIE